MSIVEISLEKHFSQSLTHLEVSILVSQDIAKGELYVETPEVAVSSLRLVPSQLFLALKTTE